MTDNDIKKYFGNTPVIYQYTGDRNSIVPRLIDQGISVNYIVVNNTVYLTASEPLDSMLDDKLSVFSAPQGV